MGMNMLHPFEETALTRLFKITVKNYTVRNHTTAPNELVLEFTLQGPLEHIHIPEKSLKESRRDELWKHTCLECFFSLNTEESAPYFEINCSPNGDWNAYYFSSYRQGMQPSQNLRVKLTRPPGSATEAFFQITIQGEELRSAHYLGVTAVLEFIDGTRSFYALNHPGPQADFHLKKSFSISL